MLGIQIMAITVASIAAQWAAWRFKVPAIVLLLGFGFILGPALEVVQPDMLMGDLLKPAISAAVAVILFEGSLQLDFKELRNTRYAVRRILLLGTPISWALISAAAHYIVGLEWAVAIVLGGALIVTGPTVIMPMLRQARLNKDVSSILKWEGIVNDSVGIILAILAFEYFVATKSGELDFVFFAKYLLILCVTAGGSFILGHVINRIFEYGYMPEYLKAPFLFSTAISLFFVCDLMLHESGLIAVTVLGITLANTHTSSLEEIKKFKEHVTLMLVSGLFILLTANLDISVMTQIDWRGFVFIAALLFVIRPIVFFLCSIGTHMTKQEVILSGLIAPRGIVCAAMAGVIGPLLVSAGFEDGQKMLPLCFAIVAISVVLHSLMIKPLARRLDLTAQKENGLIIIGAHDWTIQFCEVLMAREVHVLLVDKKWQNLAPARLANVPVYYGEILSEEIEFHQNMAQYNSALVATNSAAYNSLASKSLAHDFGSERVLGVKKRADIKSERHQIAEHEMGNAFISDDMTLSDFAERYKEGWRFKMVRVGQKEDDNDLIFPAEGDHCIHVGTLSQSGFLRLYFASDIEPPSLKVDDYLIIFTLDNTQDQQE